jgi:hypothetical protein
VTGEQLEWPDALSGDLLVQPPTGPPLDQCGQPLPTDQEFQAMISTDPAAALRVQEQMHYASLGI